MWQSLRSCLLQQRVFGTIIRHRTVSPLDVMYMRAVSRGLSSKACASKRQVLTFRPDRFHSVGQFVSDVSNADRVYFYVKQHSDRSTFVKSAELVYARGGQRLRFPPNSRGVLYYHQVLENPTESEIRFRLCDAVSDFQQGTDLLLPNGSPWSIPFTRLLKFPGQHVAFRGLLEYEYSLTLESDIAANRVVSTLEAKELLAHNQRVFDLSGLRGPYIRFSDQHKGTHIYYHLRADNKSWDKYPAGTTGMFYYQQSVTAPRKIGELRFRQCPDILSFDRGKDLCLPSGEIWCLSSHHICTSRMYETLKEVLSVKGLLDRDLHPPDATFDNKKRFPTLSSVSQPFAADLSAFSLTLGFVGRDMIIHKTTLKCSFRSPQYPKSTQPLYQGRAVVRLEPYPATPRKSQHRPQPLLAMRVLELLTPVTRLSDDEYMKPPVPGELLTVKYRDEGYVPWAFRNSSMEKAITDLLQPTTENATL